MSRLADVFRALNRLRDEGVVVDMMPDRGSDSIEMMLRRKDAWHRVQARRPLREKVEILLELQRQDLPLLRRQRPLRSWERPWTVEP